MAQPVRYVSYALTLEYDQNMVSERVRNQLDAIVKRAAREIVSKGALLANPDVLQVQALEWDANASTMVPMNLETDGEAE